MTPDTPCCDIPATGDPEMDALGLLGAAAIVGAGMVLGVHTAKVLTRREKDPTELEPGR